VKTASRPLYSNHSKVMGSAAHAPALAHTAIAATNPEVFKTAPV
jgi:hypothetical protein